MSLSQAAEPTAKEAVEAPTPQSGASRLRGGPTALVAALLAAWLLPLVTHALRVDWVLLPVAVLATAGLVRGGRTLLDRLVLALGFLYSALIVAGLLFSAWPWGLQPVAVAGFGFTALVVTYAVTGRRPTLPRRFDLGDAAVLTGTAVVAAVTLAPLLHRDLARRLGMFIHVVDFSRHLMMYDVIRLTGGYMFLHPKAALAVGGDGFLTYPQAAHFLAAVTENFLVSGTATGPATRWAADFVWLVAATYIGMALAVLWAVRHVAGRTAGWLALPLYGLGTAYFAFGDPITIFDRGYVQELPALAAIALLVAVLRRPLGPPREQVVLVGLLLAVVSMAYYLFLPVAAALTVAWLIVYRRTVLRIWRFTLVVAVLSLAAAAVIPIGNRAASPGVVLLQGGQVTPVDRGVVAAIALVALAGSLVLAARRSAAGRLGVVAVVVQAGFVVAVYTYQHLHRGHDYFGIKSLHEAMVVVTVLAGTAVHLLRPVLAPGGTGRPLLTRRPLVAAPLALSVLALTAAPLLAFGGEYRTSPGPGWWYLRGHTEQESKAARTTLALYRAYPASDGRTTVVLAGSEWQRYLATLYMGVLTHQYPGSAKFTDGILPWVHGPHRVPEVEQRLAETARDGTPVRAVASDPAILDDLHRIAASLPAGRVEVVDLRGVG
ncbi:MAG TPA: hypothetical protein VF054_16050 [Micromonosporaceae bacterium]